MILFGESSLRKAVRRERLGGDAALLLSRSGLKNINVGLGQTGRTIRGFKPWSAVAGSGRFRRSRVTDSTGGVASNDKADAGVPSVEDAVPPHFERTTPSLSFWTLRVCT
jgi:hypothetical protein